MGTVADKLEKLTQTKEAIRQAIVEKGQELPADTPFSGYAAKIAAIQTGGAAPGDPLDPVEVYNRTRPADWLPMPKPDDDEMYLLFHIPDGVSSLLAFTVTCTGSYTVALGTVANGQFVQQSATQVASGETYEAELFAADYGDLTSSGMKQVMAKVSGVDILTWEPTNHSKKAAAYEYGDYFAWSIMEISCRLPKGTSVKCGGEGEHLALSNMVFFAWYGTNAATDMSNMFYACMSLVAVLELDTSSVENTSFMFETCAAMTAIPALDTSSVTDMSGMFDCCYSLPSIPALNTSSVTNISSMIGNCMALKSLPALDTSAATDMSFMVNACIALRSVPVFDTSSATNMEGMFTGCNSLVKVEFDPTVEGWAGVPITLDNCSLGHQALVDLFNSLPTITETKTLTITWNPGVAELTEEEKAIVTGKNWTLTM